jgi:hypothetical protein
MTHAMTDRLERLDMRRNVAKKKSAQTRSFHWSHALTG